MGAKPGLATYGCRGHHFEPPFEATWLASATSSTVLRKRTGGSAQVSAWSSGPRHLLTRQLEAMKLRMVPHRMMLCRCYRAG
jgi:hypothetical protein